MLTFCFVTILVSILSSIAISKPVISLEKWGLLNTNHLAHIFYFNDSGNSLLIDFDLIKEHIQTVKVKKNGETVKREEVEDLPDNTIYELNLNTLNKGNYLIELVSNTRLTISKKIAIN